MLWEVKLDVSYVHLQKTFDNAEDAVACATMLMGLVPVDDSDRDIDITIRPVEEEF